MLIWLVFGLWAYWPTGSKGAALWDHCTAVLEGIRVTTHGMSFISTGITLTGEGTE
jgi:hypothetical protein